MLNLKPLSNCFLFSRRVLIQKQFLSTTAKTTQNTKTWLLEYQYVDNMLEKRGPVRQKHFDHTKSYIENETLLCGGALVPAIERGVIVFRTNDKSLVEDFAKNDPYVKAGLVTKWTVTEWMLVVGHEFFHGKKLP